MYLSVFTEIIRMQKAAMGSLLADMWLYDTWWWSTTHDSPLEIVVVVVVVIYLFIFTASCFPIPMQPATLGGGDEKESSSTVCRMRSSQLSAAKNVSHDISKGLDYLVF